MPKEQHDSQPEELNDDPHKLRYGFGLAAGMADGMAEDAFSSKALTSRERAVRRKQPLPPVQMSEAARKQMLSNEDYARFVYDQNKMLAALGENVRLGKASKKDYQSLAAMQQKERDVRMPELRRQMAERDRQDRQLAEADMPGLVLDAREKYAFDAFKGDVEEDENGEQITYYTQEQRDEQVELLTKVQALLTQRRDLGRGIMKEEKMMEEAAQRGEAAVVRAKPKPMNLSGRKMLRAPEKPSAITPEFLLSVHRRIDDIDQQLAVLGTIPGLREAYSNRTTMSWLIMREVMVVDSLDTRNLEIEQEIHAIRMQAIHNSREGTVLGADRERIAALEAEREENLKDISDYYHTEEGHAMMQLRKWKDYTDAYAHGRMIEIPSVKSIVEDGLIHMGNNQPFLLAGHLGAGKTEVARHMAKIHMMSLLSEEELYEHPDPFHPEQRGRAYTESELYDRVQPEFFSGSEEATVYDLVGKLKLRVKSVDGSNLASSVEELKTAMGKAGIKDVPESEIAKILLGKGAATETFFNYGPCGRALKRGVPLIIDEVNRIPPETNSRLNDLLLRRPGAVVRLQENGEEEFVVPRGFCVLGTCNIGEQYRGLQEVDAAFSARWVGREVSYPTIAETWDLIVTPLLRRDRVRFAPEFPETSVERLADLAVVVNEIQQVFTGRTTAQRFMAMAGASVVAERAQLEKTVISTRDLMRKIIEAWIKTGFKKPLSADPMRPLFEKAIPEAVPPTASTTEAVPSAPPSAPPSAAAPGGAGPSPVGPSPAASGRPWEVEPTPYTPGGDSEMEDEIDAMRRAGAAAGSSTAIDILGAGGSINVFAGGEGGEGESDSDADADVMPNLDPSQIVSAPLEQIVEKMYEDGLDEIIAKNIIASIVMSPADQKLILELFLRRGFFTGWTEKHFNQMGIYSVTQEELGTLQGIRVTADYQKANREADAQRLGARQGMGMMRDMMSGNFGRFKDNGGTIKIREKGEKTPTKKGAKKV